MADAALCLTYALWGALCWRVRGGAWETLLRLPPGSTKARIATACALALPLAPSLGWPALALAAALFAGMALAGWGGAMDIGRVRGSRWLDALAMSGWGLVAVAPALALALWLGRAWWPLAAAGLLFGPLYALAWWLAERRALPAIPRLAAGPTEWAECAAGAALAAALILTV